MHCVTSVTSVDPEYGFGNDPNGIIPVGFDIDIETAVFTHHSNVTRLDQTTSPLVTVLAILGPLVLVLVMAAIAFVASSAMS